MTNPFPVYEGKDPYIFISYAHKDSERVLPIIESLQKYGFRIWYDAGIEVGTEWPETIAEHLLESTNMIAFISRHSLDSQNCRREINFAIELRLEPLVIYLEDVQLSPGMRMQLGTLQAMFYQRHNSLEAFLHELASAKILQSCRRESPSSTFVSAPPIVPPAPNPKTMTPEECFQEGEKYYQGKDIPQDYNKAVQWYRHAADKGHAGAMYQMFYCYDLGRGVARNAQDAFHWLEKAAGFGCIPAQEDMVTYYQRIVNDPVKFREWKAKLIQSYRYAAVKGNAKYYLPLAEAYAKGNGVPKDEKAALQWYVKAANAGNTKAMYIAALWYQEGKGAKKNCPKAIELFQKASEHGHVEAQRTLAKLYETGTCGLPKDYLKASEWYRKAGKTANATWCLSQHQKGAK